MNNQYVTAKPSIPDPLHLGESLPSRLPSNQAYSEGLQLDAEFQDS